MTFAWSLAIWFSLGAAIAAVHALAALAVKVFMRDDWTPAEMNENVSALLLVAVVSIVMPPLGALVLWTAYEAYRKEQEEDRERGDRERGDREEGPRRS